MQLATIGYEGASPDDFDGELLAARVDVLVDVRAVAVSRRRGFSKTGLALRLEAQGIRYVHLRALGDPKLGRLAARAGEFDLFRMIYGLHLATPEAQESLAFLTVMAHSERVALMCFEAEPTECHRSIVAEQIATKANLKIVHLSAIHVRGDRGERPRTSHHPCEGLAAA